MKLIIVIVSESDADGLVDLLVSRNLPATKISSTSGFLRRGNATILVGVEASEVRDVTALVRHKCPSQTEMLVPPLSHLVPGTAHEPVEVRLGGAVIFVLDVEGFEKT